MPKQIGFRTTDQAADDFEKMYNAAREQNPELTKGQFFAEFLDGKIPEVSQSEEIDLSKFVDRVVYEKLLSETNALEQSLNEIRTVLNLDADVQISEIIKEIKATQQRAMMVPSEVKVQRPLEKNEILFSIQTPQLKILQETAKRLTAKFGPTVTLADLFLDVTVRYIVEMNNEWFFPHVIKSEEFKEICGYSHKELKIWLSKKPEA